MSSRFCSRCIRGGLIAAIRKRHTKIRASRGEPKAVKKQLQDLQRDY